MKAIPYVHLLEDGGCGATTYIAPDLANSSFRFVCSGCRAECEVILKQVEKQAFQVFGDESTFQEVVVYAVAVFHEADTQDATDLLAALKRQVGLADDTPIHCRVLFSEHGRAKSGWAKWSEERVFEFLDQVVIALRRCRVMCRVAAVNRTEYPSVHPAGAGFKRGIMEPKQLAGLLFHGATAPIVDSIGSDAISLYVDPDKTKIDWFGGKKQADRNYAHTDTAGGRVLAPTRFESTERPALLEIADLLAYSAAHALSNAAQKRRRGFESLYAKLRPELSVLTWAPGPPVHSVLDDNHARIVSQYR
jgi:hypothetical protein